MIVPQALPTEFPRAIRQVLLTDYPSDDQPLIDVAMDVVQLGQASAELIWISALLSQRRDLLAQEASRRETVRMNQPEVSEAQAGRLFVAGVMRTSRHLADSDVALLRLETDPDDVEEVAIELLD